jgi:hypothetical protein
MLKFCEAWSLDQGMGRSNVAHIVKTDRVFFQQNAQRATHFVVGQTASAIVLFLELALAVIGREFDAGTGPFHSFAVGHDLLPRCGVILTIHVSGLCGVV